MNVKVTNIDNGSVIVVSESDFLEAKNFYSENSVYEPTKEEVSSADLE